MKLQKIKVQNYGVFFGVHEFALSNRGLTLVLGDNQDEMKMNSNGAGKSTLFDALDWALFGVVPRGDHSDSIINEAAGRDCEVEVELEDDSGVPIMVRRWRKVGKGAGGVMLMVGGVEKSALDPDETQRLIEAELGLDRDTFHASVLFGQTDLFRFADATDGERMEALTKILQLGQIDEWLERAKTKAKALDGIFQGAAADLQRAQGVLQGLEGMNFEPQIAQWLHDQKVKAAQVVDQITQAQTRVAELTATVRDPSTIQRQLADLAVAAPREPAELMQARTEIQNLARQESEARGQHIALSRQAQHVTEQMVRVQRQRGGSCSACGQAISEQHVDGEVARLSDEAARLTQQAAGFEQSVLQLVQRKQVIEGAVTAFQAKLAEQQREHATRLGGLNAELHAVQREQATLHAAQTHLNQLNATLAHLQTEKNPYALKKEEHALALKMANERVAAVLAEANRAQEALKYVEFWVEALGPKGLKNYILDTKLQAITDAANHWVRILTGGTIWVRIETQTMGRSTGTLRNKLNVRVFRYMPDGTVRERNYKSWSGGEKQRVSLGIDLGLSSLIAVRARKRYDILILDELFRHLDSAGREAVMELLHHLKREKSSVFVVDHDADFQAQFERRVTIRKHSGRSIIVEEKANDYRAGTELQTQPQAAESNGDVPARKPRPKRTPVAAR